MYKYDTYDIAQAICNMTDSQADYVEIERFLYYLKCLAENPYNAEHIRTFCKTLEKLVDIAERNTHFQKMEVEQ